MNLLIFCGDSVGHKRTHSLSPGLVVRSECQNGGFTGAFAAVDVADNDTEHAFWCLSVMSWDCDPGWGREDIFDMAGGVPPRSNIWLLVESSLELS